MLQEMDLEMSNCVVAICNVMDISHKFPFSQWLADWLYDPCMKHRSSGISEHNTDCTALNACVRACVRVFDLIDDNSKRAYAIVCTILSRTF